jgi:hypothetical protein
MTVQRENAAQIDLLGNHFLRNDFLYSTPLGYWTAPNQPLFSAYQSASVSNVTGDGTLYTVICNTEIIDRNGDYNNATGTFLAPITGTYLLLTHILCVDIGAAHTGGYIRVITSNRTYICSWCNPAANNYSGYLSFWVALLADLDATDTAYIQVVVFNGAKIVDVYGGSPYTFFQGYLLI